MTFLVIFVLAVLFCGLVGLALAATEAELEPELHQELLINLCLGVAMAVTAGLGVFRAQHNPLPWAIGAAGLVTLTFVMPLLEGRFPGLVNILVTLSSWGAVVPILRLGRLAKENPDHAGLRDPVPAPDARQQARARSKLRAVGGDFRTATLLFVGFVVVLCGVWYGGGAILRSVRGASAAAAEVRPDQPIDAALARFEQAWGNSDPKAIEPLFVPRLQHKASRIGATLARRGFTTPYPALRDRRLGGETGARRTVTYTTDVCDVKVVFEWVDGAWRIGNFIFS
ncbi:MAG: hypothetical protein MUC36_00440 [Planctomycetes bacterium]|nr:hypothetical protein [Planctomycetota bacterium]